VGAKERNAVNMNETPPAYYARGRHGWKAWWTLLHPPYTLMHLSFVVVGAALAPELNFRTLGATVLAFFLAVGIAAHALDELIGRPLQTEIPALMLITSTGIGLGLAVSIGIAGAVVSNPQLIWFVLIGVFLNLAYNLELFGGYFHTNFWFGLAWGVFPVLTGNFAQSGTINWVTVLGAGYAFSATLTQRTLSSPARFLRRKAITVEGQIYPRNGTPITLDRALLLMTLERALRLLVVTCILVAAFLLTGHLV